MKAQPIIHPEAILNRDLLFSIRRRIHEYPELAFQEFETSALVAKFLKDLCLEVITEVGKTGVVGLLRGSQPGPTLLFRADMDALPMNEATGLPFASKKPGIHHACGHDGHVAILLITAKIVTEKLSKDLQGNIKFLFQPAEESDGGAYAMLQDPRNIVLENPHVDQCFGLHIESTSPIGDIQIHPGFFSAFINDFYVKIKGVGGHGSAPHLNKDPIYAGVHIANNFYTLTGKELNPCHGCVVTIGKFHAGTAEGVIPEECSFAGTFRCFEKKDKETIQKRMVEIAKGLGKAFEVEVDVSFDVGYPSIYNHPKETQILQDVCEQIVGKENIGPSQIGLFGEDFSYFVKERPGAFFLLGAATEESLRNNRIITAHNEEFTFNEESMLVGVSIWIKLIETLLIKK